MLKTALSSYSFSSPLFIPGEANLWLDNALGQVTGDSTTVGDVVTHAFIYQNGDRGTLGGSSRMAAVSVSWKRRSTEHATSVV
jgi:probable HAF family extracellular repeat protein